MVERAGEPNKRSLEYLVERGEALKKDGEAHELRMQALEKEASDLREGVRNDLQALTDRMDELEGEG